LLKGINTLIYTIATFKIFSNVYIFVLIFGNTISIYLKNTQNVVNIVGIQPSLKTNTKNTPKNTKKQAIKQAIKQAKKQR
jgi:Zn-dependent metalloprotease